MLSGLLLTIASEPIAIFLGWSTFIPLIVIGILLILYGAMLFRRVARAPIDFRTGMVYALADTAWVIVSLLLLFTNLLPFTTEGKWAFAIQAVIVAAFALIQFIGARLIK